MSYEALTPALSEKAFEVFVGMMFLSQEVRDRGKALGFERAAGLFLAAVGSLGWCRGRW